MTRQPEPPSLLDRIADAESRGDVRTAMHLKARQSLDAKEPSAAPSEIVRPERNDR